MSFVVYPAIDVRGGGAVRLRQGDYARETRYAADPLALAQRYAEAGARWLHLVDLDGARRGGYGLEALLRRIVTVSELTVQTGGCVRDADDVARLLEAGAARVVVGSLAVRAPDRALDWLARFGAERLTFAFDTRAVQGVWRLPVHGWTEDAAAELFDLLARYAQAGARHVLCTDIARDGMRAGPNLALYAALRARHPALALQASGGVRHTADLAAVRALGCAGAIVGTSLLDGALSLAEALAC